MLQAIIYNVDGADVDLTWITLMLSPVSRASCSRIWRVGLGVAANAAFSVSSCFALIVVRGPRRLAPSGIAPPLIAVSDALPGLPAGMLLQSPLSSAKFSLSPLLLLLLLLADDEEEQGEDETWATLSLQSTRVSDRSTPQYVEVDVGTWRSTTQRVSDESWATRHPASASGVQAVKSSVQSVVAATCLSATFDDWYLFVDIAVVASASHLSSTLRSTGTASSSPINADAESSATTVTCHCDIIEQIYMENSAVMYSGIG